MRFNELFEIALRALRANVLRSVLTVLGITIGVFAIITSVTAVKVIDVYFQDALQQLGASVFSIRRYPPIHTGQAAIDKRPPVTYAQMQHLAQRMHQPVTVSAEVNFDVVALQYQNHTTAPGYRLMGSNEYYDDHFGFEIAEGRGFTDTEMRYGRPVLLLGSEVAEALFPYETPLNKPVRIRGQRFRVVGVLAEKGTFLGVDRNNNVVAPLPTLFNLYGGLDRNIPNVTVRARTPEILSAAMEEAIGKMRVIRKVQPGKDNNFEITTLDAIREQFDLFTAILALSGAVIGFIALFAAGIGVMNIMLVSVTERTREIGIRKAVGAYQNSLLWQFLIEALVLCQIGAFIGIVLGVCLGNGVAWYFDLRTVFPVGWALGAIAIVAGVAMVFGAYPAYKAAGLEPVASLRYE